MLSDYEALEHLHEHGEWPTFHPSPTIKELCKKYDVSPSSSLISEHVMKSEIERLRKTDKGHAAAQVDTIRAEIAKITEKAKERVSSLTGRYTRYRFETRKKLAEFKNKIEDFEYRIDQHEKDVKYHKSKAESLYDKILYYATAIAIQRDMGATINKDVLFDIPDLRSRCFCGGVKSTAQSGVDPYGGEIFHTTCSVCGQTEHCNSYDISPLDKFETELKSKMNMHSGVTRKWQTIEEWKEEKLNPPKRSW